MDQYQDNNIGINNNATLGNVYAPHCIKRSKHEFYPTHHSSPILQKLSFVTDRNDNNTVGITPQQRDTVLAGTSSENKLPLISFVVESTDNENTIPTLVINQRSTNTDDVIPVIIKNNTLTNNAISTHPNDREISTAVPPVLPAETGFGEGTLSPQLSWCGVERDFIPFHREAIERCVQAIIESYTGVGNARTYFGIRALSLKGKEIFLIRDHIVACIDAAYSNVCKSLIVLGDKKMQCHLMRYFSWAFNIHRQDVLLAVQQRLLSAAKKIHHYLVNHLNNDFSRVFFYEKINKGTTNNVSGGEPINTDLMTVVYGDLASTMLFNLDLIKERYARQTKILIRADTECVAMKIVHLVSHAMLGTFDFYSINHIETICHSNAARLLFMDEMSRWKIDSPGEYRVVMSQIKAYLLKRTDPVSEADVREILHYVNNDEMVRADILLVNAGTLAFYLRDIGQKFAQGVFTAT